MVQSNRQSESKSWGIGLRWKYVGVTSIKTASPSGQSVQKKRLEGRGWHLEEYPNEGGSKSKDVKHRKKHLHIWQIYPHLICGSTSGQRIRE